MIEMILELITNHTDELIALLLVGAYIGAWFINPMPTEPLMIILGYYFGKKVAGTSQ